MIIAGPGRDVMRQVISNQWFYLTMSIVRASPIIVASFGRRAQPPPWSKTGRASRLSREDV
jgi:hypothetical protein